LLFPVDAGERGRRGPGVSLPSHLGLCLGLGLGRHQPLHLRLQEPTVPTGIRKGIPFD